MRLKDENADLKRRLESVGRETQIFAGTQIDNFEMSFRLTCNVISNLPVFLPFLTGYTRERCKEPEIGIERLIGKETENHAFFRGTPSRGPESEPQ